MIGARKIWERAWGRRAKARRRVKRRGGGLTGTWPVAVL